MKLNLGVCLTKAKNPIEKPAADMVKIGKDGRIPGVSAATDPRVTKTNTKFGYTTPINKAVAKNEAEQHHFIPPKLDSRAFERKLQILPNEIKDTTESAYCSIDVAAIYKYLKPMHGPFLIVPSVLFDSMEKEYINKM